MKTILVTGGAGYIGSHVVRALQQSGYKTVVCDNLKQGHLSAVAQAGRQAVRSGVFVKGDLLDARRLDSVFEKYRFDAVMHLAAVISVGESVKNPLKYYRNNLMGSIQLTEAMLKYRVNKIIFSSTAAVYGEPQKIPISENHPVNPTNPYGESKLQFERLLDWYSSKYGLRYVSLRYFNAAGAHPSGDIGEDHKPETHLIPLVLKVALGQKRCIDVFGDDYPTKDGTCIRDYIHVCDIAEAHILALKWLGRNGKNRIYNLGNGKGFSVKEIIYTAEQITGRPIKKVVVPRREGDASVLIASPERIKRELGWKPRYNSLASIISSAWKWHGKLR